MKKPFLFVKKADRWIAIGLNDIEIADGVNTFLLPIAEWIVNVGCCRELKYTLFRVLYSQKKAAVFLNANRYRKNMMDGPDLYVIKDDNNNRVAVVWYIQSVGNEIEICDGKKGGKYVKLKDNINSETLFTSVQKFLGINSTAVTVKENERFTEFLDWKLQ